RENKQDRRSDQHGTIRHAPPLGGGRVGGQACKDRRTARRADNDQKRDERRDAQFDHRPSGGSIPSRRQAATNVLRRSTAIVIGPTPPGTGVIAPAPGLASAKSTSPSNLPSTRLIPT